MSARRPHTKSRTGCKECKRRRVKCDETYPSCFNCERRKLDCSLAISSASTVDIEPLRPSSVSKHGKLCKLASFSDTTSTIADFSPTPAPSQICKSELELMHHYSIATADTLAVRQDMQHVWRVVVPEIGYQSSFLAHGILAVAAQHKAYLLPGIREEYLNIAAYHQALGLQGFRAALPDVNDENWKASFCFSSIVVVYVCASLGRADEPCTDALHDIIKIFVLIHGLRATLVRRGAQLVGTELAPWSYGVWIIDEQDESLYEQTPLLTFSRLPPDMFDALQRLYELFDENLPAASKSDYLDAVMLLRKAATLMAHAGTRIEIGMIMFFPYVISGNIIADIQSGNPYAMVLLTYFALLLKVTEHQFWFIRSLPDRLWEAAEQHTKDHPKLGRMTQWTMNQASKLYEH